MNQVDFEKVYGRESSSSKEQGNGANRNWTCKNVNKFRLPSRGWFFESFIGLFPILQWLPQYSIKKCLHSDLVTGLTVGIMVVPQAMGYATLAKLDPVYGLYTCFFSAFLYMIFGTSRHISIGTFAVSSMMVGSLQAEFLPEIDASTRNNIVAESNDTQMEVQQELGSGSINIGNHIEPFVLTSALTFGVGIMQLLMALCRLSFLTNYISDPLVSGFTTGAAVHVLTAQLDKTLGIRVNAATGPGMILKMLYNILLAVPHANLATVSISLIGLLTLGIGRELIDPWFTANFHLPLPLELILVVAAIFLSNLLKLKDNYDVRVVDKVPKGVPLPSVPDVKLLQYTWISCFTLAVVCFVFIISLAKIFSKKHRYKVDPNHELRAIGLCSILSSFFPVYPFGASLSRSALCERIGAKTQLHALFSSSLLFVVILWLGPYLEPLPMAILSCIVIISLKSLFLQVFILPTLWAISRLDFAIWIIAFISTITLNITWGLTLSVISVLFFNVLREQWPRFWQLRRSSDDAPTTLIFKPCEIYTGLTPVDKSLQVSGNGIMSEKVQLWRWEAPLHFANSAYFTESVNDILQRISAALEATTIPDSVMIGAKESLEENMKSTDSIRDIVNGSPSPIRTCSDSNSSQTTDKLNIRENETDREEESKSHRLTRIRSDTTRYDHYCSAPLILTEQQLVTNEGMTELSNSPVKRVVQVNHCLIIDGGAISHVDFMGVEALWEAFKDAKRIHVPIKYANFTESVLNVLERCSFFGDRFNVPKTAFYPSVHEALRSLSTPSP